MQTVLEQGSIDKPLTFDIGLIQLSFIPVCSLNTCNISVKLCEGFNRAAKINQLIILTYCLKILIFYHTKILRYPKTIIIIVIITIYDTFKK